MSEDRNKSKGVGLQKSQSWIGVGMSATGARCLGIEKLSQS